MFCYLAFGYLAQHAMFGAWSTFNILVSNRSACMWTKPASYSKQRTDLLEPNSLFTLLCAQSILKDVVVQSDHCQMLLPKCCNFEPISLSDHGQTLHALHDTSEKHGACSVAVCTVQVDVLVSLGLLASQNILLNFLSMCLWDTGPLVCVFVYSTAAAYWSSLVRSKHSRKEAKQKKKNSIWIWPIATVLQNGCQTKQLSCTVEDFGL